MLSGLITPVALVATIVIATALPAGAGEPILRLEAGRFDAIRAKAPATQFGLQYRPGLSFAGLEFMVGAMATTDKSLHGYAGLGIEIPIGPFVFVRPSFAPGLWHRGDGKDLGHAVEFRSALELGVRLGSIRVGGEIYHLSNASLGTRNPGEESVVVTVAFPLP